MRPIVRNLVVSVSIGLAAGGIGSAVLAQSGRDAAPHGGHATPMARGAAPAAESPSTAAYRAAGERMHEAMMTDLTGDPDRDFATAMIPHHRGAIDMAQILLQYGKDPELRQLAQAIIDAQAAEIAILERWLQGRP
jgi:uncharacterized protein (DUF305 family)